MSEGGLFMKHIVLLGDSIFDNAAYVAGGPDVVKQLRERYSLTHRFRVRSLTL